MDASQPKVLHEEHVNSDLIIGVILEVDNVDEVACLPPVLNSEMAPSLCNEVEIPVAKGMRARWERTQVTSDIPVSSERVGPA